MPVTSLLAAPGRTRWRWTARSPARASACRRAPGHLIVDHELRDRIDADNIQGVSWFGFSALDDSNSGDAVSVNDLSGTDVVNFTQTSEISGPRIPQPSVRNLPF